MKGTETLQMRMQDDGCALLDGLAKGLAGYPSKPLVDLGKLLGSHRSAAVRNRFVNDD